MNTLEDYSIDDRLAVDLESVFTQDAIVTVSSDSDKCSVLRSLVETMARACRLPWDKVEGIVDALLERERFGTTGLGKGLALPHLRSRSVAKFIGAIGVAPDGVDFHSLDGSPTRLIVLLLSPFDDREKHSEVMGRLATLLSDRTLQYSLQLPRSPEALLKFLGI